MEIYGIKVDAIVRLIREIVVTIFVGIVVYKIIDVNLTFDFTKLSATDLVALILAVFSVSLSAAFYFAATNSSSKFYDNMHKFTKDTSVILGQLTERLNSVDKGQDEVKSRFDRLYTGENKNDNGSEEKEKQKEQLVAQSREELNNAIERWIDKHQIDVKEKEQFKGQLAEKEMQLSQSLEQLSEFKSEQKSNILKRVSRHTRSLFRDAQKNRKLPFETVIKIIFKMSENHRFKDDLVELGFIDNLSAKGIEHITDEGFQFFSQLYEIENDN